MFSELFKYKFIINQFKLAKNDIQTLYAPLTIFFLRNFQIFMVLLFQISEKINE